MKVPGKIVRLKSSRTKGAWRLLRICRSGKDPNLNAKHPKIINAAKIVGVSKAIKFLSEPTSSSSEDIMIKRRRLPGSFGTH